MLYYDALKRALSKENARILEDAMRFKGIEFESDFAKKYIGIGREEGWKDGREEGRAEAMASSLLRVLTGRGLSLRADQRNRISSCRDLATLESWLDRCTLIEDVEELFH